MVFGRVLRAVDGAPLSGAVVAIGDRAVRTDSTGAFRLAGVPAGRFELVAQARGYALRRLSLTVAAGDSLRLFVRLAERAVELPSLIVTAQELNATPEGSSVTRLERSAIEHVQASSLADVLQLLPGQAAVNPTLAGVRQSLLRQAPTTSGRDPGPGAEAERTNALGTAVVLDGVPVSNNANVQTNLTILNSGPNALPPFASTAGRGLDLRQVPADNIERVDVIRGIPSARHGDLTAGAILVTTRAGAQRPELRLRANPQTLELSSVAGWGDGRVARGLSVDGNLVASQDDPRSARGRFQRFTGQAAWTEAWRGDRLRTTVRVRMWGVVDELRRDPDRPEAARTRSRDDGVRLDLSGTWRHGDRWRTDLTASTTRATQIGAFSDVVTRDIFPLTGVRRDTIAPGVFGRSEYVTELTVDGRPRNAYLRLETSGQRIGDRARHDLVAGIELRHDDNAGRGRRFDPLEPPRQNYGVGDRPDDLSAVPTQTQLSAYLEDRFRLHAFDRPLDLQVGVRGDVVDPIGLTRGRHGAVLSPRLDARWHWTPSLTLRAGAGRTAKAPTLSQLYPLPRYFDLISFNYFPVDPAERLVIFTTRVFDARPADARPVVTAKREAAADWTLRGATGTVTAFRETTTGAFGTTRVPVGIAVPVFEAAAFPPGAPPVLAPEPVRVDTFVAAYDVPRNTRRIDTEGAEFTIDFPEWSTTRVQLSATGGWFRTRATDTDLDIPVEQFIGGAVQPERVGAYDAGRGNERETVLTSLRAVHRAPAAGLVASLLLQVAWRDADRPIGRTDGVPVAVVDRSGVPRPLSREQALSPAFADLVRPVVPLVDRWERRAPIALVNLRLTKTLPAGSQFSVFVNNALADRPLHQRLRSPGFERRNPPLFFGVEFLAALPASLR